MYNDGMSSNPVAPHSRYKPLFRLLRPVVRWALRSGVDYREFMEEVKPVFLEAAVQELAMSKTKVTDSSLSILSGLHRKEVRSWREAQVLTTNAEGEQVPFIVGQRRPSLPSQLVAHWLSSEAPLTLPLNGEQLSFMSMAQKLSTDVHPHALLTVLERQGIVQIDAERQFVTLSKRAYMPAADNAEGYSAQELLADSVSDHLSAGLHNISSSPQDHHLDQSVFADGLSRASVDALERLATDLWLDAMSKVIKAATPLCEHDEPRGGNQRFRMGMFSYRDTMDSQK